MEMKNETEDYFSSGFRSLGTRAAYYEARALPISAS